MVQVLPPGVVGRFPSHVLGGRLRPGAAGGHAAYRKKKGRGQAVDPCAAPGCCSLPGMKRAGKGWPRRLALRAWIIGRRLKRSRFEGGQVGVGDCRGAEKNDAGRAEFSREFDFLQDGRHRGFAAAPFHPDADEDGAGLQLSLIHI